MRFAKVAASVARARVPGWVLGDPLVLLQGWGATLLRASHRCSGIPATRPHMAGPGPIFGAENSLLVPDSWVEQGGRDPRPAQDLGSSPEVSESEEGEGVPGQEPVGAIPRGLGTREADPAPDEGKERGLGRRMRAGRKWRKERRNGVARAGRRTQAG